MNMEQIKVISACDEDDFTRRVSKELQEGWRISSTNCGFINDSNYDFADHYQAILIRKEPGPKVITMSEIMYELGKLGILDKEADVNER